MLHHQRGVLLRQLQKVAAPTPFKTIIPLLKKTTLHDGHIEEWGVMSPEDLRRFKDGDEDEEIVRSTWMFRTLPPRNAASGVFNFGRNILNSTVGGVWMCLNVMLTETVAKGAMGFVKGCFVGPLWFMTFIGAGYIAALQQLLLGFKNQLVKPYWYLFQPGRWHELDGQYQAFTLGKDHSLDAAAPNEYFFRRAMKRNKLRAKIRKADVEGGHIGTPASRRKNGQDDGSLYSVLGVEEGATDKEIKTSYAKLAMRLHPDRNPSKNAHAEFDRVTKAYRVLSNKEKKRKYDAGGEQALDGLGSKKRDGLRGMFGGDVVANFAGEVRANGFSRRIIDEIDFDREEIAIVQMRNKKECAEELLNEYLEGFTLDAKDKNKKWVETTRKKVNKFVNVGLAKEVMHCVASEYIRTLEYIDANPVARMSQYATVILPLNTIRRKEQAQLLVRLKPSLFRDDVYIMNLMWYLSETELVNTANEVTLLIVSDQSVDAEERKRRTEAMKAFAQLLIERGSAYTGASRAALQSLHDSMREYSTAKAREKAKQEANA